MLSPIIVFASASIGGFALRMNMVEDFERLAPGPVAAIDTAGRSTRGRAADTTDQRLECAGFALSEGCHAPIFVTGALQAIF